MEERVALEAKRDDNKNRVAKLSMTNDLATLKRSFSNLNGCLTVSCTSASGVRGRLWSLPT
ncbi:MAG: hypothetical protein JRN20_16110 [Nitrososphaerota archaeon]|nr:hypothetical protein [Nitrososphaerota archaeon]